MMHVEICESCRRIRLVLMGLLIVFAALAGYHWGNIIENMKAGVQEHDVLLLGIVFTLLSLITAIWVETVVTRTELEAALAHQDEERRTEEAFISKEHARELNRIVEKLSEDNSDLRYRLLRNKVQEVSQQMSRESHSPASAFPELQSRAS
jgi:hypothetical protein